jgi:hypothetical protein
MNHKLAKLRLAFIRFSLALFAVAAALPARSQEPAAAAGQKSKTIL